MYRYKYSRIKPLLKVSKAAPKTVQGTPIRLFNPILFWVSCHDLSTTSDDNSPFVNQEMAEGRINDRFNSCTARFNSCTADGLIDGTFQVLIQRLIDWEIGSSDRS